MQGMELEGVDTIRRKLPFVWVFGRAFWCVSLFGANVFVENIMGAVAKPEVAEMVTGKFVLEVEESEDVGKRLLLRVEAAKGTAPTNEVRTRTRAPTGLTH
jgi:phenylacetate-CoA ligase